MLKQAAAYLLLLTLFIISLPRPVNPQQVPDTRTDAGATDLKKVFDIETAKLRVESARFDPLKVDADNSKAQAQKKGWSKTKKALVITAIAVGVAALVFVLVKYAKDCIRSTPEGCTPGVDEFCVCEEYEQRNP